MPKKITFGSLLTSAAALILIGYLQEQGAILASLTNTAIWGLPVAYLLAAALVLVAIWVMWGEAMLAFARERLSSPSRKDAASSEEMTQLRSMVSTLRNEVLRNRELLYHLRNVAILPAYMEEAAREADALEASVRQYIMEKGENGDYAARRLSVFGLYYQKVFGRSVEDGVRNDYSDQQSFPVPGEPEGLSTAQMVQLRKYHHHYAGLIRNIRASVRRAEELLEEGQAYVLGADLPRGLDD